MATSRADLAVRVADPGFTPSIKIVSSLIDLFRSDDEDVAKNAERAILRIEAQYASRVATATALAAASAERPARGRLAHLAGRLAQDADRTLGESPYRLPAIVCAGFA